MSPSHQPYNEQDLLLKLREGDELAFEAIYQKHSLAIYANILRMVRDEAAASDLLQEVFLKIWENRQQIDPAKSFKGYLFTCSRFLVLNFLRHVSIEKQVENYLSHTRSEAYEHIEEGVFNKETEGFLYKTIAQLPPQRQKVYTLCKIDGMSYEQVAVLLGISTTTVQDHIVKANRFIKDRMSGTQTAILVAMIGAQLLYGKFF
ncbi:RNA polymerase sigma factor [Parapedobacter indicus]|uniref:RNA polymerase sigma-70 factor, ECF subfamily n=1 Tax=Parapedobacter indicus TaxID=1477437 RepID=A0A1I3F2X1_9SPHI|nr:RNA polymerase sigma-70 factor [Parapedobacter indicus]PPL03537.1 RNA polymerase sigma-70 factor (ECF subfamily) [Parapedobacter indicus]SFI05513.1 RNA polymerase sigma-70 factor, ECF subfamily [Parapedobacter indicus]